MQPCLWCVVRSSLEKLEQTASHVAQLLNKLEAPPSAVREIKHGNRETQHGIRSLRLLLQTLNVNGCTCKNKKEKMEKVY